jgi:hypothetical protein
VTKHAMGDRNPQKQLCLQTHYAAIVEAHKDVEIYQLGDVDCPSCLRLMAEKHEAVAEIFRARLASLESSVEDSNYRTASRGRFKLVVFGDGAVHLLHKRENNTFPEQILTSDHELDDLRSLLIEDLAGAWDREQRARRCRVYDTSCINPSYCAAHDACCAGDPDCIPEAP